MSCWDFIMNAVRKRCHEPDMKGMYMVRADCLLKSDNLKSWVSLQHLAFLWATWSRKHGQSVNDIAFWIPVFLFNDFRRTLFDAPERVSLHWLSKAPLLKSYVSLQFSFNHPSSTHFCGNPIYDLTCRPVAPSDDGKFEEYALEHAEDFETRLRPRCTSDRWDAMIKLVMKNWYLEIESGLGNYRRGNQGPDSIFMGLAEFRTHWYRNYPRLYMPDFRPDISLLRSLQWCPYIDATHDSLSWKMDALGLRCSSQRPCNHCGRKWTCLPLVRCRACTLTFCPLCFDSKTSMCCRCHIADVPATGGSTRSLMARDAASKKRLCQAADIATPKKMPRLKKNLLK